MKKLAAIMCLVLALSFLVGCQEVSENIAEDKIEKAFEEEGVEADVDIKDDEAHMVIENEDGKTEIDVKTGDEDSWCQEGTEWSSTTSGNEEVAGTAKMMIVGIVDSGTYAGFCHVTYDVDSAETQADIDLYFDEEGSGYQVMNINGQTFESEWTG